MSISNFIIYTDGASRGNPGPAAAAFIFLQNEAIIFEKNFYLGVQTNNQAEYQAIIKALVKASDYTHGDITLYSDSELVVKQLNGEYRVNQPHLQILREGTMKLVRKYSNVQFNHVSRQNKWIKIVDKLCNQTLDNLSK